MRGRSKTEVRLQFLVVKFLRAVSNPEKFRVPMFTDTEEDVSTTMFSGNASFAV